MSRMMSSSSWKGLLARFVYMAGSGVSSGILVLYGDNGGYSAAAGLKTIGPPGFCGGRLGSRGEGERSRYGCEKKL
jgi:hypothetical protein